MKTYGELFDHVMDYLGGCDNTVLHTMEFALMHELDFKSLARRLRHHGGYCDCEVFLNAARTIDDDELIGHESLPTPAELAVANGWFMGDHTDGLGENGGRLPDLNRGLNVLDRLRKSLKRVKYFTRDDLLECVKCSPEWDLPRKLTAPTDDWVDVPYVVLASTRRKATGDGSRRYVRCAVQGADGVAFTVDVPNRFYRDLAEMPVRGDPGAGTVDKSESLPGPC
jgi:hypothetical protein